MADVNDRPGRRVQLHRALSKLGWGSRTQAWEWIRAGEVCVDGRVVTDPLTWVDLDRQRDATAGHEAADQRPLVLALHKAAASLSSPHLRSDERGRRTVYDLLPPGLPWIFPAGRLDADSEGLLILTNDATLSVRLTAPEHDDPENLSRSPSPVGLTKEDAAMPARRRAELADGRRRGRLVCDYWRPGGRRVRWKSC